MLITNFKKCLSLQVGTERPDITPSDRFLTPPSNVLSSESRKPFLPSNRVKGGALSRRAGKQATRDRSVLASRKQLSFHGSLKCRSPRAEAVLNPEKRNWWRLWIKVVGLEEAKGRRQRSRYSAVGWAVSAEMPNGGSGCSQSTLRHTPTPTSALSNHFWNNFRFKQLS